MVLGLLLAGACMSVQAQVKQEGASPDGRGGIVALTSGDHHACAIRDDGNVQCWGTSAVAQDFPPPAGPFIALSAGVEITCGLRGDGSAVCWGVDAQAMAAPGGMFTQLTVAERRACGLRPWGAVECWGDGYYSPPQWHHFTTLSAGMANTCALDIVGDAVCWGYDGPQTYPGPFTAISVGETHACALRDTGEAVCWGENRNGQATPPTARFTAIAAGAWQTCGVRTDGRVQCWGYGTVWESHEDYVAVSVGRVEVCGLRTDGQVQCWGPDGSGMESPSPGVRFGYGQLEAGTAESCHVRSDGQLACWAGHDIRQPLPGFFSEVAVGDRALCARNGHGMGQCWGEDRDGQLQIPQVPLRQLSMGRGHGCAVRSEDGEAVCWGWNSNDQAVPPSGPFKTIDAGLVHTCGVDAGGQGRCWGYDGDGQSQVPAGGPWMTIQAGDRRSCGLNHIGFIQCWGLASSEQPPTGYFRALSVGNNHSCAIRTDGRLACWGANWEGQSTPPEGTYAAVAAGEMHTCAIRSDGARVCWGAPWMGTPRRTIAPEVLPAARPDGWFHQWLTMNSDYGQVNARFSLVTGNLPPEFRLLQDGMLFGPTLANGRHAFTVEARDENSFLARRDYVLVIDDTPPVIQPMITGPLGENGWYTGDVVVDWSVADPESDMKWTVGCERNEVLWDAQDLRFHCMAESDGGHADRMVEIRRDSMPPHTRWTQIETQAGNARFAFEGDDALSGIGRFECSLDGAAYSACASPLALEVVSGMHVLEVRAVDVAGNREPATMRHEWMADATPPVIEVDVMGPQGHDGWYVGDVLVFWRAHDPDSPMQQVVGCEPVTLTSDAIGAGFTCTATSAGGMSTRTAMVKRDATVPAIIATPSTAPNASGWYRDAVTLGFACSDAASGVAYCEDRSQLLDGEGTLSSQPQHAVDAAGNGSSSNVVTVRIDRTPPSLAPTISQDTILLNATATVTANGSDALSGIAAQACDAPGTGRVGNARVGCVTTDLAGNSASGDVGYRVVYGFKGFNAPLQNVPALNLAKVGRSIPLRWRVVDAQGAPVTDLSSALVDSVAIACPATSENRITTYGGSNAQVQNLGDGYYQLDWFVPTSFRGTCRRLELNLGDGVSHSAEFKFN